VWTSCSNVGILVERCEKRVRDIGLAFSFLRRREDLRAAVLPHFLCTLHRCTFLTPMAVGLAMVSLFSIIASFTLSAGSTERSWLAVGLEDPPEYKLSVVSQFEGWG
jgi:hypothetical protein